MEQSIVRISPYLRFLSVFMVGFPGFYFVFAAFIFELQSKGLLSLVLSPLFYLSSFFWIVTGIGIQRLRHWSWYTFLAALLVTTYLNALNLVNYSDSQTKAYAFIETILVQAYVFVVVARYLRVPFLFPKIKWWESGLAAIQTVPVEVFHVSSVTGTSMGQILDLSQKGCFVKSPFEFEPYEKVKLRINAYGHQLDAPGIVVWRAESTVTHPRGIGVQFGEMDRNRRRKMRVIARRFEKERAQYRMIPPTPAGPEKSPSLPATESGAQPSMIELITGSSGT